MLDEKLQEQKNSIEQKIQDYQSLLQEILLLSQQRDSKVAQKKELESKVSGERQQLVVYKKRNKFFEFFQRTFSSKYRNAQIQNAQISENVSAMEAQISELLDEIVQLNEKVKKLKQLEQSYDSTELEFQLSDRQRAIQLLLEKQPELCQNVYFMTELLQEDPAYISYDQTNNPETYMALCDICAQNLTQTPNLDEYEQLDLLNVANKLKIELEQPQQPESDKYKIPHKYLFEKIRKTALSNYHSPRAILLEAGHYLLLDCTLPKQFGEKIQELYEDKDCYLLQHRVNVNPLPDDNALAIQKSICKEGLSCSGHRPDHISQLPTTTIGNYEQDMSFLTALRPADKVFMLIPKQAIDSKKAVPVWGADSPKVQYPQRNYVLPEYVVGYVNSQTQQFIDNPIPIQERKQYPYKFYEGETESIESKEYSR